MVLLTDLRLHLIFLSKNAFFQVLQRSSEDRVDGVDHPVANRQVEVHHKSLIVQPGLKRTLCIIGPQGGELVQKNFLGRRGGRRRSEVNHHRLVKPRLQVSKSFRNLIYSISCVFGMGIPLFFWKKVLPFHSQKQLKGCFFCVL